MKQKASLISFLALPLALIAGLLAMGCEEELPTKTELLTAMPWQYQSTSAEGTGMDSVLIHGFDLTFEESTLTIKSDNTTSWTLKSSVIVNGEWMWESNETSLQYTQEGAYPKYWIVDELTESTLKVSWIEGAGTVAHAFTH
ncbi:MAG: hypothetical protein OEX02_07825 [Cyclobacteriaceae bacterium]|nr:hypothetical protein [Cyclobacteriaceae bacterium]